MGITKLPSTLYRASISAGNGVKSAWVELSSGLAAEAQEFLLHVAFTTGTSRRGLIDIGIGPAGSEQVVIANVPVSAGSRVRINALAARLLIGADAGARIAARAQASASSTVIGVALHAIDGDSGGIATTYGSGLSGTRATAVDAGAVANTKGAWTELASSTSREIRRALVVITRRGDGLSIVASSSQLDIGIGSAGSEEVVIPDVQFWQATGGGEVAPLSWLCAVEIPAGSRLVARHMCSSTHSTTRVVEVAVIGFDNLPLDVDEGP